MQPFCHTVEHVSQACSKLSLAVIGLVCRRQSWSGQSALKLWACGA